MKHPRDGRKQLFIQLQSPTDVSDCDCVGLGILVGYYVRTGAPECGFMFGIEWEGWVRHALGSGIGLEAVCGMIDVPRCGVRPKFDKYGLGLRLVLRFGSGLRIRCGIGFGPDVSLWVVGISSVGIIIIVSVVITSFLRRICAVAILLILCCEVGAPGCGFVFGRK